MKTACSMFAIGLAAALVAAPTAASACSVEGYSPKIHALLEPDPVAAMVGSATYVDLAVIERTRPFDLTPWRNRSLLEGYRRSMSVQDIRELGAHVESWTRELMEERPTVFTFRVTERLKGRSAARFVLVGLNPDMPPPPEQGRRPTPRDGFFWGGSWAFGYEDYASSCNDGFRIGDLKATYLIFRDAHGRLLGPTIRWQDRRSGEIHHHIGPVIEPVRPGDPWLAQVRPAARRARSPG